MSQGLVSDNAVGHPAEHLLAASIDQGGQVLHRLAEEAVRRLLAHGHAGIVLGHFLTRLEMAELAETFAAVLGTAELLGRALVRDREQQVLVRHRTAQESRQRLRESAPVPIRKQATSFTCGAAALRAVLARFGIHRYESDLAGKLGSDSKDGTRPGELLGLARAFGLHAEDRHDLTVFDLAHATDQGLPVICCVQMHGGGHWVVVTDADPDTVLFMDPADGSYHRLDAPTWDGIWYDRDADGVSYVRYGIALGPPDILPATEGRGPRGDSSAGARTLLRESLSFRAVEPMPPLEALSFFHSLLPMLGTGDPLRWWTDLRRRAFTLAAATNDEMLTRVQDIIRSRLETGERISSTPEEIDKTLDLMGAGVRPGGYGETVWRTNALDSFNQGLQNELDQVRDTFPIWTYSNPDDSRSRPAHAAKNGLHFPSSVPFAAVRGTDAADVCNCRCVMIPRDKWSWQEMKARGARMADGYEDQTERV